MKKNSWASDLNPIVAHEGSGIEYILLAARARAQNLSLHHALVFAFDVGPVLLAQPPQALVVMKIADRQRAPAHRHDIDVAASDPGELQHLVDAFPWHPAPIAFNAGEALELNGRNDGIIVE